MQTTVQIGKNGLTEGLIDTIKNAFKNHDDVKVSILKSATRDREEIENIANDICTKLGKKYTYNVVGFTIFVKKWRKRPYSRSKKK